MSDELGITTAPRDGTRIMVFSGGAWYFVRWSREAEYGFGEDKRQGWQAGLSDDPWYSWAFEPNEPTHWLPEPKPPKEQNETKTRTADQTVNPTVNSENALDDESEKT